MYIVNRLNREFTIWKRERSKHEDAAAQMKTSEDVDEMEG